MGATTKDVDEAADADAAGYASLASADPEQRKSVGAGLGLTVVAMLPVVQEESAGQERELYG
ncbi:hypothetical protein ACWEDF_32925, partial [Micromonospora chersina]